MVYHFITDCRNVGGVVWELRAEEEAGALEALKDPGQVSLGAGLKATVVGGQYPGDLRKCGVNYHHGSYIFTWR